MTFRYREEGFAVFDYITYEEFETLRTFATDWVYTLLEREHPEIAFRTLPLDEYHVWSKEKGIRHEKIFRAVNRHTLPPENIRSLLVNSKISQCLRDIGILRYSLWDEGLGWLAFRFIRPGVGDGYPTSRKAWGPAKKVISAYVPIIGFECRQSIAFVSGSHLRDYPSYLPKDSKYRHDEYRLPPDYKDISFVRPEFKPGQALIFDPLTLHTEEIPADSKTRFSLEFRFSPESTS